MLSTQLPVDHGHHHVSCDTLVVSGGVDCGRRQRNVYDKKPQRYAKDNRMAHLTARSDKSVAYITNNKKTIRRFILLKLTTDRHQASCSLFVTAELLVSIPNGMAVLQRDPEKLPKTVYCKLHICVCTGVRY